MPDLAVESTFTWRTKNKVILSSIHGHLLVSECVGGWMWVCVGIHYVCVSLFLCIDVYYVPVCAHFIRTHVTRCSFS